MTTIAVPDAHASTAANSHFDRLLERIRANQKLPAMGSAIRRVSAMSEDTTQRMNELANLVLSDVYLTQRVLSIANTVVYRVQTSPVTTVSKALMLMGLNKIRVLALSATLLDHLEDPQQARTLRTDFSQAVFASMLASELARETGLVDPEEAAVAGMFRNIGQLMVGLFDYPLLEEARNIARKKQIEETHALQQLAHFSFENVSREVLRQWNIPDVLADAALGTSMAGTSPLGKLAQCAHQITEVLRTQPAEQRTAALDHVMARYAKDFPLGRRALETLIIHTQKEAAEFFSVLKFHAIGADTTPAAARLVPPTRVPAHPAGSDPAAFDVLANSDESVAAYGTLDTAALMMTGLQDMTEALVNGAGKVDICRLALETVHRAFGFDRSLLCLTEVGSGQMVARFSFGDISPAQRTAFRFDPSNKLDGIFSAVCGKNVDVHIRQVADSKARGHLPDWHKRHFPATQSLALFPMVSAQRIHGLIYGDRSQPHATDFTPEELKLLKMLRNQLIVALRSAAQ